MRAGLDDHDLAASTTDVDDRERGFDRAAGRGPEQVEQSLLLVVEDMERSAGRGLDGRDDRAGVRRATERLGADEGDVASPEVAGTPRVEGQERDELLAERAGDRPVGVDGVSETDKDRLVDERDESMPPDRGDQQVNRVGADVDRAEDGIRGRGAQRSGAPAPGPGRAVRRGAAAFAVAAGLAVGFAAALGAAAVGAAFAAAAFGFTGAADFGGSATSMAAVDGAAVTSPTTSASANRRTATSTWTASRRDAAFASRLRAAARAFSSLATRSRTLITAPAAFFDRCPPDRLAIRSPPVPTVVVDIPTGVPDSLPPRGR
jgi:hypothetical protein